MRRIHPKKNVPLYEIDEHNEAFYCWVKAKHEGVFAPPLDLLHIDAHSDMALPLPFKKSIYYSQKKSAYLDYYKLLAEKHLGIDQFILPAVLMGLIRNVYFVYPAWRKYPEKTNRVSVASAFGEGKLLKYGVRKRALLKKHVSKALPDIKFFKYSRSKIGSIPKGLKVILDIDLDYFACNDSALSDLSCQFEITKEQFLKRDSFLYNTSARFMKLNFDFFKKRNKYYMKLGHVQVKRSVHLPEKKEILKSMDKLIATLKKKNITPVVITLCSSHLSGYCPQEHAVYTKALLKERFRDLVS